MEHTNVILRLFILLGAFYTASIGEDSFEKRCLSCHIANQIPDTIIYRRYLETYSSKRIIAQKIEAYLRRPRPENSIMPPQFFYKFPSKPRNAFEEKFLKQDIQAYIDRFDPIKRLKKSPQS